jgi:hypothetical protein
MNEFVYCERAEDVSQQLEEEAAREVETNHNDCGFENARRQTLVRENGSTVDVNLILDVDVVTENGDTLNSALWNHSTLLENSLKFQRVTVRLTHLPTVEFHPMIAD